MSDTQVDLGGSLLLANPNLRDGIFDRSVILLADHSATDGAIGLILNQPTGREVGQFLRADEFEPLARIPVHVGGPVSPDQLTFSAFWWNPQDGLHWQLRLPAHDALVRSRQPGVLVRAFVGYSGWSGGQLEKELEDHAWITAKPNRDLLGLPHDPDLWSTILRSISPFHRLLAMAPAEPGLN
jgi:putative transcriptional regulator